MAQCKAAYKLTFVEIREVSPWRFTIIHYSKSLFFELVTAKTDRYGESRFSFQSQSSTEDETVKTLVYYCQNLRLLGYPKCEFL